MSKVRGSFIESPLVTLGSRAYLSTLHLTLLVILLSNVQQKQQASVSLS